MFNYMFNIELIYFTMGIRPSIDFSRKTTKIVCWKKWKEICVWRWCRNIIQSVFGKNSQNKKTVCLRWFTCFRNPILKHNEYKLFSRTLIYIVPLRCWVFHLVFVKGETKQNRKKNYINSNKKKAGNFFSYLNTKQKTRWKTKKLEIGLDQSWTKIVTWLQIYVFFFRENRSWI